MSDLQLLSTMPALAKRASSRAGLAAVASLLLRLRYRKGYTQAELARRSGITKTMISELENATNGGVTFRTLMKLAQGADCRLIIGFVSNDEKDSVPPVSK